MNLQALYDVRLAQQEAGAEIKALPTKTKVITVCRSRLSSTPTA